MVSPKDVFFFPVKSLSVPPPWHLDPIPLFSQKERLLLESVTIFAAHRLGSKRSEAMQAFLQHRELWQMLFALFESKCHPQKWDPNKLSEETALWKHALIKKAEPTTKRFFQEAYTLIAHTLKTNLYLPDLTALCWRLDPFYLRFPSTSSPSFQNLPFAIFFLHGPQFVGYHVRFRDLARGGLRTLCPENPEEREKMELSLFAEAYALAYTQQKKNKDIPEGGAKGVLLLSPPTEETPRSPSSWIYPAQQAFIQSLIQTVNFSADGRIRSPHIVDHWGKPEYLFLGPDEHLDETMIEWIADWSVQSHYVQKDAFISSKPYAGINHKEYGVTSWGVHIYVKEWLHFIGINPQKDPFTLKMSGGPDGDVAGNELHNLGQEFPSTAKLVAIRDVSGLLIEPEGANWSAILDLCANSQPIAFYPKAALSKRGMLLQKHNHLLIKKGEGDLILENTLSLDETAYLLRTALHRTQADLFLPSGGRPGTLNQENIEDFLDDAGLPSSRGIVEGANLYLSDPARHILEEKGVLIFKDSSANKGGVICSSFEVLCNLCLDTALFAAYKSALVTDIRKKIIDLSQKEASLLLRSHRHTGRPLTLLSDALAEMMHACSDSVLAYLEPQPFSPHLQNMFLLICPPTLRVHFAERLLHQVPDLYKKASLSCHIASSLLYKEPYIQPTHLPALIQEAVAKIST